MTAGVSVLVPWRPGCPHRQAAFAAVTSWWRSSFPGWRVVVGEISGGRWCKATAAAVAAAVAPAGDVLVVADADVVPYGIGEAVSAVASGSAWAMPFRVVRRLNARATAEVLDAGIPAEGDIEHLTAERRYVGYAGGGCVVLPAETWRDVPLDPRFAGWGHEDLSWALALSALAGAPWRSRRPLLHLWHPPAPRLSRQVGSLVSKDLWGRYRRAASRPLMRDLMAEARAAFDLSDASAWVVP